MTKHRTVAAFVVIALLAATTAAATMRSHSPSTNALATRAGMMPFTELGVDVNKLPTENFDDVRVSEPSLKKPVRYEAVIANWKRYRSATKAEE